MDGFTDILGMTRAQAGAAQRKKRILSAAGIRPTVAVDPSLPPTAEQAQAVSDREAIAAGAGGVSEGALKLGAAAADIGTLPVRAGMGALNTALRIPNAFGAGIPYLPENAFGGSSASMTPYMDKLRAVNGEAAPAAAPAMTQPVIPAKVPVSAKVPAVARVSGFDVPSMDRGDGATTALTAQPGITPVAAGPGAIRKIVGPDGRTTYTDQGTAGTVLTPGNAQGGFIAPSSGPAAPPVDWAAQSAAADQRLADQARTIGGQNMSYKRTDAEIAQNAKNNALIALNGESPRRGANAAAYLQSLEQGNTARLNNAAALNARMAEHLTPSGTAVAGIQADAPHRAAQTALAKQQAESAAQVEEDRKAAADIRKQMIAETDPAKYKALERKLYAIQGKAQPKYQIVTEKGVAADGITPTQTSHIVSEDTTGNPIATPLVGPGVGASAPVVVNGYRFPNQAAADRYKKDAGVK